MKRSTKYLVLSTALGLFSALIAITYLSPLGLVFGIWALITSCGLYQHFQFSDQENDCLKTKRLIYENLDEDDYDYDR
jgi:hypothetical protein